MAFSTVTITHKFQNVDGSAATGTVTFRLTKRMTNGTTSVLPTEVTATLDPSGNLSQSLVANTDAATLPTDAAYTCTVRIPPAQVQVYTIIVPTTSVDLATLLPQDQQGG